MTTIHPTLNHGFPAFAPSTAAVTAGLRQCLRSFSPLDWILGRKVTAQAELTRCRVRSTPVTCFSPQDGFDIQIDYQFWVGDVCHHGQARLPRLPATGLYQSKREAAKAVLQQSSFPVTYRTRFPSRSKLVQPLTA